jgi:hypothetical protein
MDDSEIHLHPEFGNWMVEAVPTEPYGAIDDLANLLSCIEKISRRYNSIQFKSYYIDDKY